MIHWDWPWIALLLPLPWLVRRLLPPAARPGPALFAPFVTALAQRGLMQPPHDAPRHWPLFWLLWLLLLIAAARPQWLDDAVELSETGRNLMLAVDISGSMETPDLDHDQRQSTRLDVVKEVAGEFIERREGDRVGLILFGTQAYLQTPLTFDLGSLRTLLNEVLIGMAGKQTAIGDAIGLAIKRLKEAPGGQAVLILLTDGSSNAGAIPPAQAAQLAAQAGLRIHTIGVGAERMRIASILGSQFINPSADLDENTLKMIAETTGGQFFRARDRAALDAVYLALDELEPVQSSGRKVRPVSELFPWPLGMALILSGFWALTQRRSWFQKAGS